MGFCQDFRWVFNRSLTVLYEVCVRATSTSPFEGSPAEWHRNYHNVFSFGTQNTDPFGKACETYWCKALSGRFCYHCCVPHWFQNQGQVITLENFSIRNYITISSRTFVYLILHAAHPPSVHCQNSVSSVPMSPLYPDLSGIIPVRPQKIACSLLRFVFMPDAIFCYLNYML